MKAADECNDAWGITVIIRTHDRSLWMLRRALDSVLAQSIPPIEVIVSNDSCREVSLDRYPRLFEKRGTNLRQIIRPLASAPNRSAALNRGIRASCGSLVAFLDDDDTWTSAFLSALTGALRSSGGSGCAAAVCRTVSVYERVDDDSAKELGRELFNPDLSAVGLSELLERNRFTLNAVLWRRSVFEEIGDFREDLSVLEDWEFNVRAARRFKFAVCAEACANYHQRSLSDGMPNSRPSDHDRVARALRREWHREGLVKKDRLVRVIRWVLLRKARFGHRVRWFFR